MAGGNRVGTMGAPMKVLQNTFALGEGQVKVVDHLTGFRKFTTVLADHLPFIKDGDIVMLREPAEHMIGEATVLAFKHLRGKQTKTALVLKLHDAGDEELTEEEE